MNAHTPPPAETLPHNLEAEQAFLGALLYDNELYHKAADWLSAPDFYDPVHQRIYTSACSRIARGSLADAIVLKTDFERDGGLQEIGGAAYLAVLLESAADSVTAVEYARLVHDLALRRSLIRTGEAMISEAREAEPETPGRALIEQAEQALFTLAEAGTGQKGFVSFSDALAQSIDMAANAYQRGGGLSGISTGLAALDGKLGGLHASDLIILAGRPSMGKTALAANIAFSIARNYSFTALGDGSRRTEAGGVVGFFSLEMSAEQLATRLIAEYTGIPGFRIRKGEINQGEYEEIRDAALEIQSLPLFIDDTGGLPIAALCARARRMKRLHGLDLIVVDYLQLAGGGDLRRRQGRVQEVSEITQALKALAKELGVPVLALSQLSRQVEQREDKKPQLSDLRESGSIEQDADVVCFVYREEYYKEREQPAPDSPDHAVWEAAMAECRGKAEVIIGKQRHGPIGTARLAFNGTLTKFSDTEERE